MFDFSISRQPTCIVENRICKCSQRKTPKYFIPHLFNGRPAGRINLPCSMFPTITPLLLFHFNPIHFRRYDSFKRGTFLSKILLSFCLLICLINYQCIICELKLRQLNHDQKEFFPSFIKHMIDTTRIQHI